MFKINFITIFLVTLLIAVCSCKKNGNPKDVVAEDEFISEIDPIDEIDKEQRKFLDSVSYYVMATNGLSLRKVSSLSSEKLLTMPKGSKLKMTEVLYTIDTIIDYMPGSMVGVAYNENMGYAYSGYLTEYYIPKEPITADEYIKKAASIKPDVNYVERRNNTDFHEGYNGDLTLPNCSWQEAFYVAKAIYGIPDSFNFPNPSGDKT